MSGRKQVQKCWYSRAYLFDHLVGASEQNRRHLQPYRLGRLQIDHKLELGRLLHWKISGPGSFEKAIDVYPRRVPEP